MAADTHSEAERSAKASLFGQLVEQLPGLAALRAPNQSLRQGSGPASGQDLAPVLDALAAMRRLAAGRNTTHQNLFRCGYCTKRDSRLGVCASPQQLATRRNAPHNETFSYGPWNDQEFREAPTPEDAAMFV